MAGVILGAVLLTRRLAHLPALRPTAGLTREGLVDTVRGGTRAVASGAAGAQVGFLAVQAMVVGAVDVLLVVLVYDLLRVGDAGVGLLTAALGAGAALGAAPAAVLVGRRRLTPALFAGSAAWGVALVLTGLLPTPLLVPLLLALGSVGRTAIEVGGQTLLQRVLPDRALSRAFGLLEGLRMLGLAVGFLVTPVLLAGIGDRATFITVALALPLMVGLLGSRLRHLDARADVPTARLGLVRGVPFFAPLSQITAERIARRLVPLTYPAGAAIVTEGAPGDRFYLLEHGTVVVSAGGREVDRQGRGGYFGEVALLLAVPRTATVRAVTKVDAYGLERDDFLEAVTGQEASRGAAHGVVQSRLERTVLGTTDG